MKLQLRKLDLSYLKTPSNYASVKGVDRKYIYRLIDNDVIDYVEIDGVKFVYMNNKAKKYYKTK